MSDSSSASTSSSKFNWKVIAATAAAVVGVTGLAYAYFSYKNEKPAAKSSTSVASTAPAKKVAAKKSVAMPESELKTLLEECTVLLNETGQHDQEDCVKLYETLNKLNAESINEYTPDTRIKATEFLLVHHSIRSMTDAQFAKSKQVPEDMNVAYKFISFAEEVYNSLDEQQKKSSIRSALDIAIILKDVERIKSSYEQLLSYTLNPIELTQIFTTAPILGKWTDFIKYGQQIMEEQVQMQNKLMTMEPEEQEQMLRNMDMMLDMDSFHRTAVMRFDLPDFHALLQFISDKYSSSSSTSSSSTDDLCFESYDVIAIKKSMKNINQMNLPQEQKQTLLHHLEEEEKKIGKTFFEFTPVMYHVDRQGAIVTTRSFSPYPVPLQGTMTSSTLDVNGYLILPDDVIEQTPEQIYQRKLQQEHSVNLTENISLKYVQVTDEMKAKSEDLQDVDNQQIQLWEGTYEVIQRHSAVQDGPAVLHLLFNLSYKLKRKSE